MAEWRLLTGWSSEALRARLEQLQRKRVNFDALEEEMTGERGWHHYHSDALIASHAAGAESFERARSALANYKFSDPRIVVAHFDPATPVLMRRLLLEIRIWGLRYLCPALVSHVRDEPNVYAFRYDTLEGHIERGVEWFVLTRDDAGDIRFRIEARWKRGEFPNWWSRFGFVVLSGYYQRRWHRHAHQRLAMLALDGSTRQPRSDASGLTHQGVHVTFTYHTKRRRFL
jgi:uncharacterized protein (UPF0548 family)